MKGGRLLVALLTTGLVLAGCQRQAMGSKSAKASAAIPAPSPACLILTAPQAENALTVNSGAQVEGERCEIHVDSRFRPAAILNADSRLDVAALCVAGDIDRHGGLVTQPLQGCSATIDPDMHATAPPEASAPCDRRPHAVNGGSATLRPGVYCGGLAFNGAPHITFGPGLYVIRNGDWTFNGGRYVGREISFYFADGSKPVFNSGVDVDLAAPASGPRAGMLMDEAAGLPPSALTFNDARRMNLEGFVHLPSRRAVFNSGSKLSGSALTAVFDTAVLNQTHWTLGGPAERISGRAAPPGSARKTRG